MSRLRLVYTTSKLDPQHAAAVNAKHSADDPGTHVSTLFAEEFDADVEELTGAEEDDAVDKALVAIVVVIDQFLRRLCARSRAGG